MNRHQYIDGPKAFMLAIGAGIVALLFSEYPIDLIETLRVYCASHETPLPANFGSPLHILNSYLVFLSVLWTIKLFFDDYWYFSVEELHGSNAFWGILITSINFFILFQIYTKFSLGKWDQVWLFVMFNAGLIVWSCIVFWFNRNPGKNRHGKNEYRIWRAENLRRLPLYCIVRNREAGSNSLEPRFKVARHVIFFIEALILIALLVWIWSQDATNTGAIYAFIGLSILTFVHDVVLAGTLNFKDKDELGRSSVAKTESQRRVEHLTSIFENPAKGWKTSSAPIQSRIYSELPTDLVEEKAFVVGTSLDHLWSKDCDIFLSAVRRPSPSPNHSTDGGAEEDAENRRKK